MKTLSAGGACHTARSRAEPGNEITAFSPPLARFLPSPLAGPASGERARDGYSPTRGDSMSKNPAKDFGPIADDYAFFETHATEAANDSGAYVQRLARSVPAEGPIRMLDFGCGSGTFTARFLEEAAWPAARLHLTLVEPVEAARREALARTAGYSDHPAVDSATPPGRTSSYFEVVLANHSLYYVPGLPDQLAGLIDALSPAGVFVTAIASRANALIEFWITGFGLVGKE